MGHPKQDKMLAAKGYLPARTVAEKMNRNITTVYRWLDDGNVQGVKIIGDRYVNVLSLVKYIGVQESVLLGLITQDEANKIPKK